MSRYGGGQPRYSGGDLAYREPPPSRWDADRFARERDTRISYERDEYSVPSPRRPARAAPVYEDERYYERDSYSPRGSRVERRYYEEDDYYDPRARQGAMVPFRAGPPPQPAPPPRPGLLRRQSSLDTFDRPPARRFHDQRDYEPRRQPEKVYIPVPEPPSPRGNRYRPSRDRYSRDNREFDDVYVQDPDYYGDDGFREYREREWIKSRRRDDSHSRSRSRSRPGTEVEEKRTEIIIDDKKTEVRSQGGRTEIREEKEIIEEREEKAEKPYPRRGKTRMPKRLVHTKVLFDLGYPFYEENEKTIIIEKALGPDNIDEVFVKSKEYREREVGTTRLLEAPPPQTTTTTIVVSDDRGGRAPTVRGGSVHEEEFFEEKRTEEIRTVPFSEAPRSVREWDNLTVEHAPSHRSQSQHHRSPSAGYRETVIEKRETLVERSPSPARTQRTSRSRRQGSFDGTEIVERRIVREEDDYGIDESNSVHVGPLALVVDRNRPRSDREIKEEIAKLQRERRRSRREREYERDDEIVKIERVRSRPPSPQGEVIIERRGDEIIEVRKDRRERSKSRARPPSSNLIKNMMYTLT